MQVQPKVRGSGHPKQPFDHDPDQVRRARLKAGLTLKQLGARIDRSESHLSDIERGRRNAPSELLDSIAHELGVPRWVLERKEVSA